jgi:hypothetical protein
LLQALQISSQGWVMVRLLEAITVLLTNLGSWRDTWRLKIICGLGHHQLRGRVAILPSDMSAEILATSDLEPKSCHDLFAESPIKQGVFGANS